MLRNRHGENNFEMTDQGAPTGEPRAQAHVGYNSYRTPFWKDMNMRSVMSAMLLSFAIGAGTALAQAPAPAPTGQPASSPQISPDQKKAISKSCTDQANAKGLHGKARKKFRSECKKAGGKPQ
jgi:psiF repeat